MHPYRAPEPPSSLPRAIVRRPGAVGAARWVPRIFILPHTTVGLSLLVALLYGLASPLAGHEVPGVVTSSRSVRGKGNNYSCHIEYSYQIGGETLADSGSVPMGVLSSPPAACRRAGEELRVWQVALGPLRSSHPYAGESPWAPLLPMAFFCTFWNAIVSIFLFNFWVKPLRNRWLVRNGAVAPGRVLSRRSVQGKGARFIVEYEFTAEAGVVRRGEMDVSTEALWNTVSDGQPVTVLYSPDNHKFSLIYECCDHAWAGDPAAR